MPMTRSSETADVYGIGFRCELRVLSVGYRARHQFRRMQIVMFYFLLYNTNPF